MKGYIGYFIVGLFALMCVAILVGQLTFDDAWDIAWSGFWFVLWIIFFVILVILAVLGIVALILWILGRN